MVRRAISKKGPAKIDKAAGSKKSASPVHPQGKEHPRPKPSGLPGGPGGLGPSSGRLTGPPPPGLLAAFGGAPAGGEGGPMPTPLGGPMGALAGAPGPTGSPGPMGPKRPLARKRAP